MGRVIIIGTTLLVAWMDGGLSAFAIAAACAGAAGVATRRALDAADRGDEREDG
jgi:hypothetical protein